MSNYDLVYDEGIFFGILCRVTDKGERDSWDYLNQGPLMKSLYRSLTGHWACCLVHVKDWLRWNTAPQTNHGPICIRLKWTELCSYWLSLDPRPCIDQSGVSIGPAGSHLSSEYQLKNGFLPGYNSIWNHFKQINQLGVL